jgi:hypothetical protein
MSMMIMVMMMMMIIIISTSTTFAVILAAPAPPSTATLLLRERVTCETASELAFGKVLWLDDRVHAAEALFRGQPCVAIRPLLSGGAWLASAGEGDTQARRDQLLQWLLLQRDALAAAHPAIVAASWGGCFESLNTAVLVFELTQRWADVVADVRLGVAQRIRIALNALELVHYLNVFPRTADAAAAQADRAADKADNNSNNNNDDDDFTDAVVGADSAARDTVVLGMAPPEFFSVSGDYFVKLALLKRIHVYRGSAYGNSVRCKLDADCRTYFFRTKHMLRELRDSPPDDFNCNLSTNKCHGLDWRTNLLVVCRELLAPLFGVTADGNVAPPGARPPTLPYPVRNSAANALRSCLALDPARRPYPRDLQKALSAISDASLPLFFTPRNDIVSQSNTTALQNMLADVRLDPHVVAQNRFKAPMALTDWAFQFASGMRDMSLVAPPIQAVGTHDDQPWISTPIADRESPHTVRTHSGSTYRLMGAPSCSRFARLELSAALCAKLQDGLPSNWRELFDAEWQRIFATVAGKHFASQLNNSEAPPARFELAQLHDAFQPPPTPAPTVHFRLIPTQPPSRDLPKKGKATSGKVVAVDEDTDVDEDNGDEDFTSTDYDRQAIGLPKGWNNGHNHDKLFHIGPTNPPQTKAPAEVIIRDPNLMVDGMRIASAPSPARAPGVIVREPVSAPSIPDVPPPAIADAPPAVTPASGDYCLTSNAQLQALSVPMEPYGGRFRLRVTLNRAPKGDARLLIGASYHEKPRIDMFSALTRVTKARVEPVTDDSQKTSYVELQELPFHFQLHFACLPRTCDINLVETIINEIGKPNTATTVLGRAVPQHSQQLSTGGIRVLGVQQTGDSQPGMAIVCIDDMRLTTTPPRGPPTK